MDAVTTDAWARHQRIIALYDQVKRTFIELGRELYWFQKEKQFLALDYPTFESYLADPDVDIDRTTAFKLKRVYQRFELELECTAAVLLPVGPDKLDVIRPHVDEGNVGEWLASAATLSRSDLRHEVRLAFDPPDPAPPGAVVGEVNGNRVTLWCQTQGQIRQIVDRLSGLVEWE